MGKQKKSKTDTLTVGVCYTKTGRKAIVTTKVCDCFIAGVNACGDKAISLFWDRGNELKALRKLNKCDVVVQYGEWNFGRNKLRGVVHEYCHKNNTPKIILDIGFVLNYRKEAHSNMKQYSSVGMGRFKRDGEYFNKNSRSDRWEYLEAKGVKVKPWRKDGKHIVIFGQNNNAASTAHIDFPGWLMQTLKMIKKQTKRPVIYRQHPNAKLEDIPIGVNGYLPENLRKDFKLSRPDKTIEYDLHQAWCSITKTSNACVESLLEGVPVITDDELTIAYDVCGHDFSDIENPHMPDRTQFFYDLAYCQWSIPEIKVGMPWMHLKPHIQKMLK